MGTTDCADICMPAMFFDNAESFGGTLRHNTPTAQAAQVMDFKQTLKEYNKDDSSAIVFTVYDCVPSRV